MTWRRQKKKCKDGASVKMAAPGGKAVIRFADFLKGKINASLKGAP
jgi:hypothetical protein